MTTETIRGRVQIAIDYVDVSDVTHLAARIYMNDGTLSVPPGSGTAGGTLAIPAEAGDIRILHVRAAAKSREHQLTLHAATTAVSKQSFTLASTGRPVSRIKRH